jgi:hypothetical protein
VPRRKLTKRELIDLYYYRKEGRMPETGVRLQEGADDIKLNVAYMINDVEDVKTEVGAYSGLRVELLDAKGNVGTVMLWKRPVTSPKSKLGSFVNLLGSNTDRWLRKWIIFRGWQQNNRAVERTEPPVERQTKATTDKGILKAAKEAKPNP